jgi:hypothetical protein
VMGLTVWGLLQNIVQGEPKYNCHDNQLLDIKINWNIDDIMTFSININELDNIQA